MENLILVNKKNRLSQNYEPKGLMQEPITKIWLKKETYKAFYKMSIAIQAAGFSPIVLISGYRPYLYQEKLYNRKVENLIGEGLSKKEAIKKASTIVAVPGTSEHQTGLAIDITSTGLAKKKDPLIEEFEATDHGKWLKVYGDQYGFILRYPKHKTHITHISYEPWHYRYVGTTHAKRIKQADMCLEEYITYLDINNYSQEP